VQFQTPLAPIPSNRRRDHRASRKRRGGLPIGHAPRSRKVAIDRTLLGALAARADGAGVMAGALRAGFRGALAMAVTAGVGALFGTVA
jgi:hypothetical protein